LPYLPTSFPRPGPLCTIYVLPCIRPFHLISRSFHRHLGHSPQLMPSTALPFHLISGHSIGILAIQLLLMHGSDSLAILSHLGSCLGILAIPLQLMAISLFLGHSMSSQVIPRHLDHSTSAHGIDGVAISTLLMHGIDILAIPTHLTVIPLFLGHSASSEIIPSALALQYHLTVIPRHPGRYDFAHLLHAASWPLLFSRLYSISSPSYSSASGLFHLISMLRSCSCPLHLTFLPIL
jgi:hypothetical protein